MANILSIVAWSMIIIIIVGILVYVLKTNKEDGERPTSLYDKRDELKDKLARHQKNIKVIESIKKVLLDEYVRTTVYPNDEYMWLYRHLHDEVVAEIKTEKEARQNRMDIMDLEIDLGLK